MIYISSASVKAKTIREAVELLVQNGFTNIELSGGTNYYDAYEKDLLELQSKYNINYLVHNYFPPPKENFVLNLSSLNESIYQASMEHCKKALELSKKLGGEKVAFHAGFLSDLSVKEIGKKLTKGKVINRNTGTKRFLDAFKELKETAMANGVQLYFENNVLSQPNYESFGENPFLAVSSEEIIQVFENTGIPYLLDIAHLKVSCETLGLNFPNEIDALFAKTDYIHFSDNDGRVDSNIGLGEELKQELSKLNWQDKTVTLEIYESIDVIRNSYQYLNKLKSAE